MSNLPPNFQFSQSSLQDYHDCARRFELRYLKKLAWPAIEVEPIREKEAYMRQGAEFHRLLQQHFLGIPIMAQQLYSEELRRWWQAFEQYPLALPPRRYAEETLSGAIGDFRLRAKFDLLAFQPGEQALIVDWKTSRHLPTRNWLEKRLQTRVYRWLLAHAGYAGERFAPEQITLLYWFAEAPNQPVFLPYSDSDFAADERYLAALMEEAATRSSYPLTDDHQRCRFCRYRSLCDRGWEIGTLSELQLQDEALDVIELDAMLELEF